MLSVVSQAARACVSDFPESMQINPTTKVDIAIPSWHINGHGERCRRDFYLGYTRGAGRTCGEEVETTWSSTNALASSMREMAPGARHETLNDHWNGWNFRKIVRFRMYFPYPILEAFSGGGVDECQAHGNFREVFSHIPSRNGPKTGTDGRTLGKRPKGTKSIP